MAADINLRDSKEDQLQNMVIELLELLQDSGDQSSASSYKKKLDKLNGIFSDNSTTSE